MKKSFLLILNLLIVKLIFAQFQGISLQYSLTRFKDNVNFGRSFETDSVEGFASGKYLNKEWIKGFAILKNDAEFSKAYYNLDLENDLLIYTIYVDSVPKKINNPDTLKSITIGDKLFKFIKYKNGIISGRGFFEVLVEGECRLLLRREVSFIPESPSEPYKDTKPAHFQKSTMYYIQKGEEPAFEINKNAKSILNALEDKSPELKLYMKKNSENARSKESLIKIVEYYNTISATK